MAQRLTFRWTGRRNREGYPVPLQRSLLRNGKVLFPLARIRVKRIDALMFITSAMRLIENTDGEAFCLLEKTQAEIISAQEYLEVLDPIEAPISDDVAANAGRVCRNL